MEATITLTCGCCLTFGMIWFTLGTWREQQGVTGVNFLQQLSSIQFNSKRHNCSLSGVKAASLFFFSMPKDHFSLPLSYNLFVAGQFIECWLFKLLKESCVFLEIKGQEILDLGVIVIFHGIQYEGTIWSRNCCNLFYVLVIVQPRAAFSWQFGVLSTRP